MLHKHGGECDCPHHGPRQLPQKKTRSTARAGHRTFCAWVCESSCIGAFACNSGAETTVRRKKIRVAATRYFRMHTHTHTHCSSQQGRAHKPPAAARRCQPNVRDEARASELHPFYLLLLTDTKGFKQSCLSM